MNIISQKDLLLNLKNEKTKKIPIWLMRQAGRYLPEYREIRSNVKDFLELCYSPKLASEVTLQPIRRFNFDAAIIFSDILVIPHAMGLDVAFKKNEGPVLEQIQKNIPLLELNIEKFKKNLEPVYEAITLTRSNLPSEKALIGFAGSPWTLACYMVEGGGSKNFSEVKKLSYNNTEFFSNLISSLVQAITIHLIEQIKAGAEIIQLFDSWSGMLDEESFNKWILQPTEKIIYNIKEIFPSIPVIGFPKGSGIFYKNYAKLNNIDAISLDYTLPLDFCKQLQELTVVQGNLDPTILFAEKNYIGKKIDEIIDILGKKPFIFNLGHGILPETPIENVEYLVNRVKGF